MESFCGGGDGWCRAALERASCAGQGTAGIDRWGMVDCPPPLCLAGIGGWMGRGVWDFWSCWAVGVGRDGRGRRARGRGRLKSTEGAWWNALHHFVCIFHLNPSSQSSPSLPLHRNPLPYVCRSSHPFTLLGPLPPPLPARSTSLSLFRPSFVLSRPFILFRRLPPLSPPPFR